MSLLFSIPGIIALVVLFWQHRIDLVYFVKSKIDDINYFLKSQLGQFYTIDQAVFRPFLYYTSANFSSFTSSAASITSTLYGLNSSISNSTISATNGTDLILSNSNHQVTVTQLAKAINELQMVRQELCEMKVKYHTRLHQLEQIIQEKEK
ncbi:MAG: hypothetical protein M0R77_02975 [Gammaproteobacteria bacterium]|nr:hypothetical protein [Gammaproteobacteria bacterium]